MAGPNLDVLLGLREGVQPVDVSIKISRVASSKGLGLIFGTALLRRLYSREGEMLDKLSKEIRNPLIFTVTSNPLATDAFDLFENQVNPWTRVKPSRTTLLEFFDELWLIEGISGTWLIVWDSIEPSAENLPKYEMRKEDLEAWIIDYYKKDLGDSASGAEGIFHIRSGPTRDSVPRIPRDQG
jgi:hypothetical protein